MEGSVLWGLIREYVQAEVRYRSCYDLGGPGAGITKDAAEQVTRAETAAREAFQDLLPPND